MIVSAMSLPVSTKKHDAGRALGPQAVPSCIEVILVWSTPAGRLFNTTIHGRNLGSFVPSVASANTLQTAVNTAFTANLAIYHPTTYTLFQVKVRDMSNVSNPQFTSTGAAAAGTSASINMPESNAIVLTENVNIRGRGAKGRIYIPNWATNADAGGGNILAAVQTALNTFGTSLLTMFTNNGMVACVAKPHRLAYMGVTGTSHTDRPAATADVVSYTCRDLLWDTQRRRTQP